MADVKNEVADPAVLVDLTVQRQIASARRLPAEELVPPVLEQQKVSVVLVDPAEGTSLALACRPATAALENANLLSSGPLIEVSAL